MCCIERDQSGPSQLHVHAATRNGSEGFCNGCRADANGYMAPRTVYVVHIGGLQVRFCDQHFDEMAAGVAQIRSWSSRKTGRKL